MHKNWQLGMHSFWQQECTMGGKYMLVKFLVQGKTFYFSFDSFFLLD